MHIAKQLAHFNVAHVVWACYFFLCSGAKLVQPPLIGLVATSAHGHWVQNHIQPLSWDLYSLTGDVYPQEKHLKKQHLDVHCHIYAAAATTIPVEECGSTLILWESVAYLKLLCVMSLLLSTRHRIEIPGFHE